MAKHHALIVPVTCPIDQYATIPCSIMNYDVYWELKGFRYYEKRKKIRMGSFGVLRRSYEGHSLVFLHPYEVLSILSAKLIMLLKDGVRVIDFSNLARHGVRSGVELNEFLANKWYEGSVLIVSSYVAEVAVGNLTIKHRHDDLYEVRYCYGRVDRVVNKMNIDAIISSSRLIAMPHKVSDPLEKAYMVLNVLAYHPPRWPWMNYGIVVDKSRRLITVLNPDVMSLIDINNLEELRVMDYVDKPGWEGNYVPIIVVRKLTLTPPPYSGHSNRLEVALWRAIQEFKVRVRGGVFL